MSEFPYYQLGALIAFAAGIISWMRVEISRKTNGAKGKCEEFRLQLEARLVRIEERMSHVLQADIPEFHVESKELRKEIKDINDQLSEIRGKLPAMIKE